MRDETPAAWPFAPLHRRALLRALLRGAVGSAFLATLPLAARARLLHDENVVLAVVGILQPASAAEVFCLLEVLFDAVAAGDDATGLERPEETEIAAVIDGLHRSGDILAVLEAPARSYSVTARGNRKLNAGLTQTRDKTRLFLLRGPRARTIGGSREGREGVAGGASPLNRLRSRIEGLGRPFGSAEGQRYLMHAHFASAGLWLRRCRTSPLALSRDAALRLLSFDSIDQLAKAGGTSNDAGRLRITSKGVALCLGVSSELLGWLQVDRRARHYRVFTIPKRDGGRRRIESPRIFLKVTQRFILHHLLADAPVHDAVYSFVPAAGAGQPRNAISNARRHLGRNYLAKIDIADFFGSLRYHQVQRVFLGSELVDEDASHMLARLCTLPDERGPWAYLPQGAPTSPMLSNLALHAFDERMAALSGELRLTYTRYADDIAISGAERQSVKLAAMLARKALMAEPFRLAVNARKSRFSTSAEQQRVTGVVVNERGLPPRTLRRRVRAMFHQASLDPARLEAERARLRGYLNYFRAFPDYPVAELARYTRILGQT